MLDIEKDLVVPISGYLDASGKTFEPFVTFAAVFIPDALSAAFDKTWRDQLEAKSVTAWHTTDAMSRGGEFSSRSGWDLHKVCRLRNALLNVLSEFSMNGVYLSFCAVDCSAARKLQKRHPDDVPEIARICLDHTVGAIRVPPEDEDKPDTIKLYFDRDEEFFRVIRTAWEKARKRQHHDVFGWPQQVKSVGTLSSKECPGLQAADLVAWAARRRYEKGDQDRDPKSTVPFLTFLFCRHLGFSFGEDSLRKRYVEKLSLRESGATPPNYKFTKESRHSS